MSASGTPSPQSPLKRPSSFLLDTNILIAAEDHVEVDETVFNIYRLAATHQIKLCVHEGTQQDFQRDKDEDRRRVSLSKTNKYPSLAKAPLTDEKRVELYGEIKKDNDRVDTDLLHSVHLGSVDYLITQDEGIHARAKLCGLGDKVLRLTEALDLLNIHFAQKTVKYPRVESSDCAKEALDPAHQFFDSLKQDYGEAEFVTWLCGKAIQGRRPCFIIRGDSGPDGLLIHNEENRSTQKIADELDSYGVQGWKVMKICLFRLANELQGDKFGEQLLKAAMDSGFQNNFDTLYLTVFAKHEVLIALIKKFGFTKVGTKTGLTGIEEVYAKPMRPAPNEVSKSFEFHRRFWPQCDLRNTKHFMVPIGPEFHERLFPEKKPISPQLALALPNTLPLAPGNAIRKVYICHAQTNQIAPGSLLWFYRSKDSQLTSVGVLESYQTVRNLDELKLGVGQRSVFTLKELESKVSQKQVRVLNFYYSFHLNEPISLKYLRSVGILKPKSHPQSLMEIKTPEKDNLITFMNREYGKYLYNG